MKKEQLPMATEYNTKMATKSNNGARHTHTNVKLVCNMCGCDMDDMDIRTFLGWYPRPNKPLCSICLRAIMEFQDQMATA